MSPTLLRILAQLRLDTLRDISADIAVRRELGIVGPPMQPSDFYDPLTLAHRGLGRCTIGLSYGPSRQEQRNRATMQALAVAYAE